jgi:hypothetical protein
VVHWGGGGDILMLLVSPNDRVGDSCGTSAMRGIL